MLATVFLIDTQEIENDAMDAGYPEYFRGQ